MRQKNVKFLVHNHEDLPNEEVHSATRWGKEDTENPEVEFLGSNSNNDNDEKKHNEKKEEK